LVRGGEKGGAEKKTKHKELSESENIKGGEAISSGGETPWGKKWKRGGGKKKENGGGERGSISNRGGTVNWCRGSSRLHTKGGGGRKNGERAATSSALRTT